jgi:hypothetical protein
MPASRNDNTHETVNKAADAGRDATDKAAGTARRVTDEVTGRPRLFRSTL